jgi:hypothetical protein
MRIRTGTFAIAAAMLLAACAKPVPPDKSMFVGEWQAPDMYLLLQKEGKVVYRRVQGSTKTSVEGPLTKFDGDNFTVGVWFMATTFVVTEPPHEVDGSLRMTVDGVELRRVGDGSVPAPPNGT